MLICGLCNLVICWKIIKKGFGLMVFSLFKSKKKEARLLAHPLYVCAIEASRQVDFYQKYQVPDTMEGRYDLLILHVFLLLEALNGRKDVQKALIDLCFADMDQNLRQMGVGDMGVPRRIKKMAKAFNGRSTMYHKALVSHDDEMLRDTLDRNVFESVHDVRSESLDFFVSYTKMQKKHLEQFSFDRTDVDKVSFATIS